MGEALLAVLPGKGWNREPGDPLIRPPDFLLRANMDTIFVDQALQAHRDKTGDLRPFEALPVEVTSKVLRRRSGSRALEMGAFLSPQPFNGPVQWKRP